MGGIKHKAYLLPIRVQYINKVMFKFKRQLIRVYFMTA